MHYKNTFVLIFLIPLFVFLQSKKSYSQVESQVYSYSYYQKYNSVLYSPDTRYHTASKPFLFKGELLNIKDSLESVYPVSSKNWFMRKIFNEHLVQVQKEDHSFYLDFMPDMIIGKELVSEDKRTTYLNTRGIQVGLNIKDKFTLTSSFYENQGVFANYMDNYISKSGVVPGQSSSKNPENKMKDWMYASASLTYDFSPYFQTTLAFDKNHIGDGYRSLLLSDFSSNYTHLKLTGTIGNVHYTSIWAYMNDPMNPRRDSLNTEYGRFGDGIKYGAFQYLDYNATNRLSLGFFQAVIWSNSNQAGYRGIDFNYFIPGLFVRPVENNNRTSPDKMHLGMTAKYKVLNNLTAYGQFLLGEFTAKEFFANTGYAHNKWGVQLGVRGYDALGIKNLNFLGEYNLVRPYTYQHYVSISNYSNNGEPLAHPRGANFRELVGLLNYSWKRFDFSLEGLYSMYGTDPANGDNMGGDIFQSYSDIPNLYGNKIGQGVRNNLYFADLKASYVFNPKYNLRIEANYTHRVNQIAGQETQKSGVISIGLRSSFRPFYGDF